MDKPGRENGDGGVGLRERTWLRRRTKDERTSIRDGAHLAHSIHVWSGGIDI